MDKLTELLKQLGGSDELITQINEELARYGNELKEQYDADFRDRIQKARQICLEEVQKEKAALSRKVSIFLESKLEAIEKTAEKQRLQEDTEAVNKLKNLRALLEGVSFDDEGQSRELHESKKQLKRSHKALKTLKEERDIAVRKANSANGIALKTLQRNRLLESKAKAAGILSETKPKGKKSGSKAKGKAKPGKTVTEGKNSQKQLAEGRQRPAQSKTTRETLAESQARSKKGGDSRIANIAASIEVD
ncbi:MAG: hypothetical protein ACTSYO_02320 [Candidatus Ranarchaeia archaeon]